MREFFNSDNWFLQFMSKVLDLILLNFLWIFFSLPVITIGASTTALYYVTLKICDNTEGYIFRSFVKAFASNLRQATISWLIFLFSGGILFLDFRYWISYNSPLRYIIIILTITVIILYLIISLVFFPLLARFQNTLIMNFKNTFIIAIKHFLTLIPIVLLLGLVIYLNLKIPFAYFIMAIIGFSGFAQISSYIYLNIFKKY